MKIWSWSDVRENLLIDWVNKNYPNRGDEMTAHITKPGREHNDYERQLVIELEERIAEIDRLSAHNALLRAVAEAAGVLCESMYGANHPEPLPVELLPPDRVVNMDALLSAWGAAIDGGALED